MQWSCANLGLALTALGVGYSGRQPNSVWSRLASPPPIVLPPSSQKEIVIVGWEGWLLIVWGVELCKN